jgi:cytochrome c551/c552
MMTRNLLVPALLAALTACTDRNPTASTGESSLLPDTTGARNLLATHCMACHGNEGPDTVGPAFRQIAAAYATAYIDSQAYVEAMAAFIAQPDPTQAMMPAAVATYGPMPNMGYRIEDALKMAAYLLFHGEVSGKPARTAIPTDEPLEQGRSYTMSTKAVLGSNLLAAIKQYGPEGAVDFCHTHALPLTDSMATHHGAAIRRVSDRPRKPLNRANAEERAYIAALKNARANGEELGPRLVYRNNTAVGYYAIETSAMCLQCHGSPHQHISPATLAAVNKKYPADEATGYGENEIRGIWVVELPYRP